jgi:hypothetical protein
MVIRELNICLSIHHFTYSRGSAVGIATGYWLDDRWSELEYRWSQEFLLLHVVQGIYPASYQKRTAVFSPRRKEAGA